MVSSTQTYWVQSRVVPSSGGYNECGLQQASKPIQLGLNGQKHLEVTVEQNVKALIYAWQKMSDYKKLLRWSWTSRGLVTKEEMQEMHPDIPEDGLLSEETSGSQPGIVVPGVPALIPSLVV